MFIIANFIAALATILDVSLKLLQILIFVRVVISWVNPDPYNMIVQILNRITEPIIAPFRKLIPSHRIGLDLSPLFAILAILFLRFFLVPTLFELASRIIR